MNDILPEIRNTVRACIIRNGKVLVLKKQYEDGTVKYALPGGGQHPGETIQETLFRECFEELGIEAEIEKMLFVADYFKLKSEDPETYRHQLELFLYCSVAASYEAKMGSKPDRHQVGVEWIDLNQVAELEFSPYYVKECLLKWNQGKPLPSVGVFHDRPAD